MYMPEGSGHQETILDQRSDIVVFSEWLPALQQFIASHHLGLGEIFGSNYEITDFDIVSEQGKLIYNFRLNGSHVSIRGEQARRLEVLKNSN